MAIDTTELAQVGQVSQSLAVVGRPCRGAAREAIALLNVTAADCLRRVRYLLEASGAVGLDDGPAA